jgi:hypothetical protein
MELQISLPSLKFATFSFLTTNLKSIDVVISQSLLRNEPVKYILYKFTIFFTNQTISDKSRSSSLRHFMIFPLISLLLVPSNFLGTLFLNIRNLYVLFFKK